MILNDKWMPSPPSGALYIMCMHGVMLHEGNVNPIYNLSFVLRLSRACWQRRATTRVCSH